MCTWSSRWLTTVRWPSFSKKAAARSWSDDAADGRDVGLLHREHDVVLQRLVEALDEDVVGRQPGRADAEAGPADDVLDVVEDRLLLAFGVRQGRQVPLERPLHLAALGLAELAHTGAAGEAALVVHHLGRVVEHLDAGAHAGGHEHLVDGTVGVVEPQGEGLVLLDLHVVPHLVDVRVEVGPRQPADVVLGQRLLPAHQREAGDETPEVPGEVAEVRLVEVVDVEDQHALGVHVGAEVLGVQVAVDPDATRPVVRPRVIAPLAHVRVEEAGLPR